MDLLSIRNPFYFRDSLPADANVPVEFSTSDLNVGTYWLYAADIYGIISEPATVTLLVGVEEHTSERISICPNPAKDLIIIETNRVGQYSIEINSINGQLIRSVEWNGTSYQLDLSSFRKGAYLITLRSEDFVTTRKIIKL
ncbi:MAG: T9SS type A sorting domain-containing protein [Bacteroidota bacterium]